MRRQQGSRGGSRRWLVNLTLLLATLLVCVLGLELVCRLLPTGPDKTQLNICGEHGGEPNSVEFCHLVGMNYVSCSPFRVPIARLAAAHAQINHPRT